MLFTLLCALTLHAAEPSLRFQYIRSHFTKQEARIPMRDGARLFVSIYAPTDAGTNKKYPFFIQRTPYGAGPYGANRYRDNLWASDAFEKEGFIFVIQDVRGRGMSDGEFVNMRPINPNKGPKDVDESTDAYDTIDWLLKHVAFNNGKAGMAGISYPGFYAAAGAIDSHPALKAVSPQAPIQDWFWEDMHRHGAFAYLLAFNFFYTFGVARTGPTDNEEWKRVDHGTPDGYQYFLDLGAAANARSRFDKAVPFWEEILAHPDYDSYWQARNLRPHLKNVKAATLVVGGFYDAENLYGALHAYQTLEKQNPRNTNTVVMGPWFHGGWHRSDGANLGDADFGFKTSEVFGPLELAFFQQHLKDGDKADLPEALMFEGGANRFRKFDSWPPKDAVPLTFTLAPGGQLRRGDATPAPDDGAFDEYVSDPNHPVPYTAETTTAFVKAFMAEDQRFASRRPDVLTYQTEPLLEDLTLAGPLDVNLNVSTTGTDADWVVKLVDVNPPKMPGWTAERETAGEKNRGGQQTLVRGEPFRGRYRDSYTDPKPFEPGKVTPVKFTMNDVLHTFLRGHRVMVQVQSSMFPFVDRNPQKYVPNIYQAAPADYVKATQRVYHSAAYPSSIKLHMLSAAP